MPNFAVFNPNPDDLRALIFGRDTTNTSRILATDPSGNLTTVALDGTIASVLGTTVTAGTINNLLNGTISSVLGATVTAGTLSNLLDGTLTNILGATITAGTLSNLLAGTISSVLGATVTAGTLSNLLDGTISNLLGATITAGTLSSVTSISQKSFTEIDYPSTPTADALTPLPPVTTANLGTYSFFVYNAGPNPANLNVEISANGTNWYIDVSSPGLAAGSVDVLVPSRFLKYTRLSYASATTGASTTIDVFFNAQGT
ncbi:DUF6385 domain-containing protein [Kyrpidia tusciae]|uniref:DUF6385 domain-containing protein n=1 Tax=Kyrpidia tusciae (strain DSM 2912 / NBRC 15312 / T2) TaxID=562970 RepID=D5WXJ3_KYRT2|nr:DUF6385 domain-containing protein [Kyrpidia tusciae]ADG05914.1 conserved hypothetical protein [Kyrpidia tusciae DSM 2912]